VDLNERIMEKELREKEQKERVKEEFEMRYSKRSFFKKQDDSLIKSSKSNEQLLRGAG